MSDPDKAEFIAKVDSRISLLIKNTLVDPQNQEKVRSVVQTYDQLTTNLRERSDLVVRRVYAKHVELAMAAAQHAGSSDPELSDRSGKLLGAILYLPQTQENFTAEEADKLLAELLEILKESTDKATVTRCIWVFVQQQLPESAIEKRVPQILASLQSVCNKQEMASVLQIQNEIIRVYVMLNQKFPREMILSIKTWVMFAIKTTVSQSQKVRERALSFLESFVAPFQEKHSSSPNLNAILDRAELKQVFEEMQVLLKNEHELFVLKLFVVLVRLLGKMLHQGSSLLNGLLKLEEACFKSSSPDTKRMAFLGWRVLIENFALDPKILLHTSRMKLLMQPLNNAPCPNEEVALEKLKTWWKMAVCLRSELEENFTAVCVPLLRFCIGGKHEIFDVQPGTPNLERSFQSPITPRTPQLYSLNLVPKGSVQPLPKELACFESVQSGAGEIMAKILMGSAFRVENGKYENSNFGIQQPITVLQHGHLLLQCLRIWAKTEYAMSSESRFDICFGCCEVIFRLLGEASTAQAFSTAVESALLQFRAFVEESMFSASEMLRLYEVVLKGLVGKMEALSYGEEKLSQECPALYLLEPLLFSLVVVNSGTLDNDQQCKDGFSKVLHYLVKSLFLVPPVKLLDCVECFFTTSFGEFPERLPGPIKVEVWEMVASKLQDFLQTSSEINQGDTTDPNFVCAFVTLAFPVVYISELGSPADYKNFLLIQWKRLYQEIQRCISLVSTTEPNTLCQEFSNYLLRSVEAIVKDGGTLYMALECCKVMVEMVDYGALAPVEGTFVVSLSPSKFEKKKDRKFNPLGQLHPLAKLIRQLAGALMEYKQKDTQKMEHFGGAALGACLGCLIGLFDNATVASQLSALVELFAADLGSLLKMSDDKESVLPFKGMMTKMDLCLTAVCNALRNNYGGPYDSQFLEQISPLLEGAMRHSRRTLKNEILTFWGDSFAKASTLSYPDSLKKTLTELKDKSWISTPGLGEVEKDRSFMAHPVDPSPTVPVTETAVLNVPVAGQASPQKTFGSMLKRKEEEEGDTPKNDGSSGVEFPAELERIAPDDAKGDTMKMEEKLPAKARKEFVVIPPAAKKPMVLTQHQKEVMQTRKEMPFMEFERVEELPPTLPPYMFAQSQDAMTLNAEIPMETTLKDTDTSELKKKKNNRARKSICLPPREEFGFGKKDLVTVETQPPPLTKPIVRKDPKLDNNAAVVVLTRLTEEELRGVALSLDSTHLDQHTSDTQEAELVQNSAEVVMSSQPVGGVVPSGRKRKRKTAVPQKRPPQLGVTEEKGRSKKQKKTLTSSPVSPISLRMLTKISQNATEKNGQKKRGRPSKKKIFQQEQKEEEVVTAVSKVTEVPEFPPVPVEGEEQQSVDITSELIEKAVAQVKDTLSPEKTPVAVEEEKAASSEEVVDSALMAEEGGTDWQEESETALMAEEGGTDWQEESETALMAEEGGTDWQEESETALMAEEGGTDWQEESEMGGTEVGAEPFHPEESLEIQASDDSGAEEGALVVAETPAEEAASEVTQQTEETPGREPPEEKIVLTPGILKKTTEGKERSPSPDRQQSVAKKRHVHFAPDTIRSASDDEISGRRLLAADERKVCSDNGKALEAEDKPKKAVSTPPMSFIKSFAPRTLKMIEATKLQNNSDGSLRGDSEDGSLRSDSEPAVHEESPLVASKSDLDSSGPIYPELTECTWKIDPVLPTLTTTTFVRGLSNLLKAKNLNTVGDLAKLSEAEVHQLPLRSPKTLTLRSALEYASVGFRPLPKFDLHLMEEDDDLPLKKLDDVMNSSAEGDENGAMDITDERENVPVSDEIQKEPEEDDGGAENVLEIREEKDAEENALELEEEHVETVEEGDNLPEEEEEYLQIPESVEQRSEEAGREETVGDLIERVKESVNDKLSLKDLFGVQKCLFMCIAKVNSCIENVLETKDC